MAFLAPIAEWLGTDPVSLVALSALSAIGAFYMKRLSTRSWVALIYFPVLLAGALLADDAAVAFGIHLPLTPGPAVIGDGLPHVLAAGLVGMTIAGLVLIGSKRALE